MQVKEGRSGHAVIAAAISTDSAVAYWATINPLVNTMDCLSRGAGVALKRALLIERRLKDGGMVVRANITARQRHKLLIFRALSGPSNILG